MANRFAHVRGHTFLTPPPNTAFVVLDVGANHGEFARQMAQHYGGTYYLVEANPSLAAALRKEGSYPVWHCAVAAEDGSIRFHLAPHDECSSILSPIREAAHGWVPQETVLVPSRRLESILSEIQVSRIDLLKLDIEGAEVQVLESLPITVLKNIGQITVEFHSDPSFGFDLHQQVEQVIHRLRRHGFLCLDFTGQTRCDVLFINTALHRIAWTTKLWWSLRWNPPPWVLGAWRVIPAGLRDKLRPLLQRGRGTTAS